MALQGTGTGSASQDSSPNSSPHSHRRSRTISTSRTITGNLAADVEVVKAGSINITKFRVIENTGEYRAGRYIEHVDPTTHFVEAKFELGENAAATLHKGDAVIVVGREHTKSWGAEGSRTFGRVIDADHIGADLSRAVAQIRRNSKPDDQT